MRYRYVTVYRIKGLTPPAGFEERVLLEDTALGARALVMADVNPHLVDVDRAMAVANSILKVVFHGKEGAPEERIAEELEQIQSERRKKVDKGTFLVFEGTGDIQVSPPQNVRTLSGFSIAIDGAPKTKIRARYRAVVNGVLASLALAAEDVETSRIADGVTFTTEDNKPLYWFTVGGSAKLTVSKRLEAEMLESIGRDAETLSSEQNTSVARLLSQSAAEKSDSLLSFLSAWAALEIFVNKNFHHYEDVMLARLVAGEHPALPQHFVERLKTMMGNKYSLADKFSVIALELAAKDAESDQETFEQVKKARDRFMHGEDMPISTLPTRKVHQLLQKYLRLHLGT